MRLRSGQARLTWGALLALAVGLWPAGPAVLGQSSPRPPSGPGSQPSKTSLAERQLAIRDRVQRLESRMLKLSHLLAESEPAKAERLRDALQYAGSRRIKARVEKLTELLESEQLGEADRQQELLLADLDALLTLLTSSLNEAERRRAERQRLEALKRTVRELIDEQLQILYRTQHVEQRLPPAEAGPQSPAPASDVAEMLRQLERLQRAAQRKAGELERDMQQSDREDQPAPGTPQVDQAEQEMRQAADRLGEHEPGAAGEHQKSALEQLQQALDELDDALRQVRREETEETLAALETRFRSMLRREKQVLEAVAALDNKGPENWTRVDELQLAESAETQQGVSDDCEATRRILLDEGTTVIVPELLRQMVVDTADVSARLQRADTSPETQDTLADIIALLEEFLGAIEQKREADARSEKDGGQSDDRPQPLLPGSAELKLLRWSQVRINQRTGELARAAATPDEDRAHLMERLSERQRRLAELARRMNERE